MARGRELVRIAQNDWKRFRTAGGHVGQLRALSELPDFTEAQMAVMFYLDTLGVPYEVPE